MMGHPAPQVIFGVYKEGPSTGARSMFPGVCLSSVVFPFFATHEAPGHGGRLRLSLPQLRRSNPHPTSGGRRQLHSAPAAPSRQGMRDAIVVQGRDHGDIGTKGTPEGQHGSQRQLLCKCVSILAPALRESPGNYGDMLPCGHHGYQGVARLLIAPK